MPKKDYIIKDWMGGMIRAKSPQSLEDNESQVMYNFVCMDKGKLVVGPAVVDFDATLHSDTILYELTPGEGMFVGGSDYGLDYDGCINEDFSPDGALSTGPGTLINSVNMTFATGASAWTVDKHSIVLDLDRSYGPTGGVLYGTSGAANYRDAEVFIGLDNAMVNPGDWFQIHAKIINTTKSNVAKAWNGDLQFWIGKGSPAAGREMRPYKYASSFVAGTGGQKGGIYVTHGGTTHDNQWSYVSQGKQGTWVTVSTVCQASEFTNTGEDAFLRIFGHPNGDVTSSTDAWVITSCQVKKLPTNNKPKYGTIMANGGNKVYMYSNFEGGGGEFNLIDYTPIRYSDYGTGDAITEISSTVVPDKRLSRPSFYQGDQLIRMSDGEFDWAGSPKIYGVVSRSQKDDVEPTGIDKAADVLAIGDGNYQEELTQARYFPEFRDLIREDHNPNSCFRRKNIYPEANGGTAWNDNPPLVVHSRPISTGSESDSDYDILKTCTFSSAVGLCVSHGHSGDEPDIDDRWKKKWHFGIAYKLLDNTITNVFEGGLMDNDNTNQPVRYYAIDDPAYSTDNSYGTKTGVEIDDQAGSAFVSTATAYLQNDIVHSLYIPTTGTPSGTNFSATNHSQTMSVNNIAELNGGGASPNLTGFAFRSPKQDGNVVDMTSWTKNPRLSFLFKFDRMHPDILANTYQGLAKANPYSTGNFQTARLGMMGQNYWDPRIVGYTIWAYAEEDTSPDTDIPWHAVAEVDLQTMKYAFYCGDSIKKDLIQPHQNSSYGYATYNDGQTWTSAANNDRKVTSGEIVMSNAPSGLTYREFNGYSADAELDIRWKHAVVCNNRTILGNLYRNRVRFPDRIAVSYPGTYDSFPEEYQGDIYMNDGEDITALATFADRVLIFKSTMLYVYNYTDPENSLIEASHKFYGVPHHSCVATTPYGISWVSMENGVLHYDGEKIISLMNGKFHPWQITIRNTDKLKPLYQPALGYDSKNDALILKFDNYSNLQQADPIPGPHGMFYSFKNEDWMELKHWFHKDTNKIVATNFITLATGDCVFYRTGIDGTSTYPHTSASNSTNAGFWAVGTLGDGEHYDSATSVDLKLLTKDVDFGDPGRLKNVYKVIIRYSKGSSSGTGAAYGYTASAVVDGNVVRAFSSTTRALDSSSNFVVHECLPDDPTHFKNIKSIAIQLVNGTDADDDFALHDITIIYRDKTIG